MNLKSDFVTMRFLGESVASQEALLLIHRPDKSTYFHHCRILRPVEAPGYVYGSREKASLQGGETIECVRGAVRLMDMAACRKWDLYAEPPPFEVRKLVNTPEGHLAYMGLGRKKYRLLGQDHPDDYEIVHRGDNSYQSKFAGGSNR